MRLVNRQAAETIVMDLANGEKIWRAHPLGGEAVKKLATKPGRETVAIATKGDGRNAWKIRTLGGGLPHAAFRGSVRQPWPESGRWVG